MGAGAPRVWRYRRPFDSVIRSYSCLTITQSIASLKRCGRAAAGLAPGDRLPSVRELMARDRASPVTVQRAIARARRRGPRRAAAGPRDVRRRARGPAAPAPSARRTSRGSRSRSAPRAVDDAALQELLALPPAGAIPLSSGYLEPELQPLAAARRGARRAPRGARARGSRGPVEGREELRAWFAREAGGGLRAHDMVVCPGGQSALATAFRALAAPGRDRSSSRRRRTSARSPPRAPPACASSPVASDADGVRPDLLADALRRTGARVVYCQPLFANPHGATLARRPARGRARRRRGGGRVPGRGRLGARPRDRRRRAAAARRRRPRRPRRLPALADEVRGARAARSPRSARAAPRARGCAPCALVDDLFVSGPLQEAALELVSSPAWRAPPAPPARRAARAPRRARRRRRAALPELRVDRPSRRAGCTSGRRCPTTSTTSRSRPPRRRRAASSSTPAAPGSPPSRPAPFLRLTFAAAPPEALDEGVAAARARAQTMIATAPPSTDHAAPVTMLARALEHRNTTTSAISSGSAKRPERDLRRLRLERLLARDALRAAPSGRRARRRPSTAALPTGRGRDRVDEHAARARRRRRTRARATAARPSSPSRRRSSATAACPTSEQTLTIRPQPRSAIRGAAARISRIGAITWSSHWPLPVLVGQLVERLRAKLVPALLTSTSTPPSCSAHVATIRSAASGSVTSAATHSAPSSDAAPRGGRRRARPSAPAPPPRQAPRRSRGRCRARAGDDARLVAQFEVQGPCRGIDARMLITRATPSTAPSHTERRREFVRITDDVAARPSTSPASRRAWCSSRRCTSPPASGSTTTSPASSRTRSSGSTSSRRRQAVTDRPRRAAAGFAVRCAARCFPGWPCSPSSR